LSSLEKAAFKSMSAFVSETVLSACPHPAKNSTAIIKSANSFIFFIMNTPMIVEYKGKKALPN
jgi:hypothetical protein